MVLEWVPVSVCIDTYGYEVHTSTYAYNARSCMWALIFSCVQGWKARDLAECDWVFVSICLFVFFAIWSLRSENQTEFSLLQPSQKGRWVGSRLARLVFSEMEYRHMEVRACMQIEIEGPVSVAREFWNSGILSTSTSFLRRIYRGWHCFYTFIQTSIHINHIEHF